MLILMCLYMVTPRAHTHVLIHGHTTCSYSCAHKWSHYVFILMCSHFDVHLDSILDSSTLIGSDISSSQKVVVFLSNNLFELDDNAPNWLDMSLSLSLSLNKQMIIFILEDLDEKVLNSRKDVKAALKVNFKIILINFYLHVLLYIECHSIVNISIFV